MPYKQLLNFVLHGKQDNKTFFFVWKVISKFSKRGEKVLCFLALFLFPFELLPNFILLSSEKKMNNTNSLVYSIPLHQVKKHKEYNGCISKAELKLTDFTWVATLYPLLTQQGGVMCSHPSMFVCHIITRD
jgi:hypothetical protein